MKQFIINKIYNETEELTKQDLTIQGKWIIYKIRKTLLPHIEFYQGEVQKLLDEYKPEYENENLKFKTPEIAQEFLNKEQEVENFEVEVQNTKESLKLSDIPGISIQQMELLEDFIEFVPE